MNDYVAFMISNSHYALPVDRVHDIVRAPHVTPVPLTTNGIRGILNLRGAIVTLCDMTEALSVSRNAHLQPDHVIVLKHQQDLYGLCVDAVRHVFQTSDDAIKPLPGHAAWHDCARGLVRMDQHAVILLDTRLLIERIMS